MMGHYIPIDLAHLSQADIAKVHAYADARLSAEREKDIIDAGEWQGSYEQERKKREALERDLAAAQAEREAVNDVLNTALETIRTARADLAAAQPEKPDNAIALVSSDDADSLYATVQWLLNPLPGGSLLFERPDPRIAEYRSLLREALGALMGDFEINPRDVRERIEAALKEE